MPNQRLRTGWAALAAALTLAAAPLPTPAASAALEMARQLNQAFIEVADQPSVIWE